MDQLPIDIHLTKLLDWILDRRQAPRDWQKSVLPIRNKINLAIQDMPEHEEIAKLLSGSSIHYFNCLQIVEILKETEKNSKNIFGMYSSQRMKDWSQITSAYQKGNIYLAEACSILQRNVAYEIPALRKQINKSQQLISECDEKHTSLTKSINEINLQIKQFCTELGIKGENVAKELKELPSQLSDVYETVVQKTSSLERPHRFYLDYVEYFFERKDPADANCLPILGYLIKKGNTTVFEWRTGVVPKHVEKQQEENYNFGDESSNNAQSEEEDKIDFGDIDVNTLSVDDGNEEIDWGDIGTTDGAPQDLGIDFGVDENQIDFDLDELRKEISVEGTGVYIPTDGVAKGNDAYTILEWAETRNLLLNDLIKLEKFLKHKLSEMKTESDNLVISTIMQDAPKSIQSVTEKDIQKWIDSVVNLLSYMKSNKRVEKLIKINDSPKYLKRLYDQYQSKIKSIERCNRNQEQQRQRQAELAAEIGDVNEKLKLIIQRTKELQKSVCADLSKKYNGVRINLMGEINLL